VANGAPHVASEVVREALRLMDEKDRLRQARLDQLRNDIHEGMESGAAKPWDADQVKREGRARRASKSRESKA